MFFYFFAFAKFQKNSLNESGRKTSCIQVLEVLSSFPSWKFLTPICQYFFDFQRLSLSAMAMAESAWDIPYLSRKVFLFHYHCLLQAYEVNI